MVRSSAFSAWGAAIAQKREKSVFAMIAPTLSLAFNLLVHVSCQDNHGKVYCELADPNFRLGSDLKIELVDGWWKSHEGCEHVRNDHKHLSF